LIQKADEEAQKNERIANSTNRSTYLHLGEKKNLIGIRERKLITSKIKTNSSLKCPFC
jgi:hypothetical protein